MIAPQKTDITSAVGRATRTLQTIVDGSNDMQAVRHPMGFVCFPVERDGTSGTCVHMWTPDLPSAELLTTPVHSHSWDLESLVVWGELVNELYTVHADEPSHRLYEVRSRGAVDELTATTDLLRCERSGRQRIRASMTYRLASGHYHASFADRAVTVALGTGKPGGIDRALGPLEPRTCVISRERYSRRQTEEAAGEALERLREWLRQ